MYYKRLSLRVAGVHGACVTVVNVISDFLIYTSPINDLTCSTQAALYSDVSTVDLLFWLSVSRSLAFKGDSVSYGKFVSGIEELGDFLWY